VEVVIINYGLGNIKSIANSLTENQIAYKISDNSIEIENSDLAILPGVGSFPAAMSLLTKKKLIEPIKEFAKSNKPLIGICLGMQILFEKGLEFEETPGLGLIEGKVEKIPIFNDSSEKIPNIGWRDIKIKTNNNPLLKGISEEKTYYFTHSYHCIPKFKDEIQMTTSYASLELCASVRSGNVYGFQFHPEKSAEQGLKIIKNIKNL
jgi:glutamine amidotransferase